MDKWKIHHLWLLQIGNRIANWIFVTCHFTPRWNAHFSIFFLLHKVDVMSPSSTFWVLTNSHGQEGMQVKSFRVEYTILGENTRKFLRKCLSPSSTVWLHFLEDTAGICENVLGWVPMKNDQQRSWTISNLFIDVTLAASRRQSLWMEAVRGLIDWENFKNSESLKNSKSFKSLHSLT